MDYNITYRNKDNGIQVIVSYKDTLGKWKQKSKQGFPDTREGNKRAKAAADEILQSLKENSALDIVEGTENITVGELKKDFLSHISIHREYNTYLNYKQSLDYFPVDKIEVSKLKVANIQKCVNELAYKFSLNTIDRRITIFKCMLNFANRQYNIPIPNMKNIIKPSGKSTKGRRALTNKNSTDLLEFYKTRGRDYYVVVLLALKCGLRVGEIMGLTWQDIDFEKRLINIDKQWKIDKITKKYNFGDPKSKHAYRKVPFSNKVASELKRIKGLDNTSNLNNRIILSGSTQSMCVNLDRQLQRRFKTCIHELRHTYATDLISNGTDFKTAAKLLGHDIEQTMKNYSHVTDDMLNKASELIDKIF